MVVEPPICYGRKMGNHMVGMTIDSGELKPLLGSFLVGLLPHLNCSGIREDSSTLAIG